MRIHCFQHVPFETLGNIEDWIALRGHTLSVTRFFAGDALPNPEGLDCLIVMGGPMGAGDDAIYPWLTNEKKFIRQAIDRGMDVLGICLGAQLIAYVLGAKVYPNTQKEIGWFPIRLTREGLASPLLAGFPEALNVFHWHGDTFDLPVGAKHLASSAACKHQAFSYGRHVLALQFHLDVRAGDIADWVKNGAHELQPGPFVQTADQMLAKHHPFDQVAAFMQKILGALEKSG
ncbi:MAG: gamma-glutamyl-gamma-aminobutyrate hydrolase family protein [Smithellaceae bacterium]